MRSLIILAILVIIPMITGSVHANDQRKNFTTGIIIGGDRYTSSNSHRYTCNAARVKIHLAGFDKIKTLNCTGKNYQFVSVTKSANLLIMISSHTGIILNISPI